MGKLRELYYCQECGKKLDKIADEGRERMKCGACNKIAYENPVPATAAVVFNEKGELLLVKRNVEPKSGEWCLPGGFVEIGETPEECCIRELEEETGLRGQIGRIIAAVPGTNPFYKSVIVKGFSISEYTEELKAGDDSDESKFFSLEDMPPVAFRSHREILDQFIKKERYNVNKRDLKRLGAYVITSGDHVRVAEEACHGGAKVIQYRDKKSSQAKKLETARKIREITEKTGTLFIVNDHMDIALLAGADGVHLGQDDVMVSEARNIVPENFIIGKSTHSLRQALKAEADGADYIGVGPVYETPTKEDYIPIGVDTVKMVMKKEKIPFVCIGGLNLDNYGELIELGAKNVAMVREFQTDTAERVKKINRRFRF